MDVDSTSGESTATSGAVTGDNQTENTTSTSGEGVPKTHVEKILKESKNKSAKIAELEAKLNEIADSQLNEQQQYKELADKRLARIQELEAKDQATRQREEKARKLSAVEKHLSVMGLKPEHKDVVLGRMLEVEDLIIDPDTGAVLGAEDKAKDFRQQFGNLGFFGKAIPGTDSSAPQGQGTPKSVNNMTTDDIKAQLRALKQQGV